MKRTLALLLAVVMTAASPFSAAATVAADNAAQTEGEVQDETGTPAQDEAEADPAQGEVTVTDPDETQDPVQEILPPEEEKTEEETLTEEQEDAADDQEAEPVEEETAQEESPETAQAVANTSLYTYTIALPDEKSLKAGGSGKVSLTSEDAPEGSYTVEWTVADADENGAALETADRASIDSQTGLLTGKAAGRVIVTALVTETAEDGARITVTAPASIAEQKGWLVNGQDTYYYVKAGEPAKGVYAVTEKEWYWFNETTGVMKKAARFVTYGARTVGGAAKAGSKLNPGIHYFNNKYQFYVKGLNTDKNGYVWNNTYKSWLYADAYGACGHEFQKMSNGWHYFDDKTGMTALKPFTADKEYKLYKESGKSEKKSKTVEYTIKKGTKLFFTSVGVLCINGWNTVDGKKYYFDKGGNAKYGFQTISKKKYYIDKAGGLKTGWFKVSGKWYLADTKGVIMVEKASKATYGWFTKSGKKYYIDKKKGVLTGFQTISKKTYYFDSTGWMATGWYVIGKDNYYFDSKGVMAKSKTVNGIRIGADGKAVLDAGRKDMMKKAKGYSSSTSYLILVNKSIHRAGIFKKVKGSWELQRYFPISVGKFEKGRSKTPSGTFKIGYKLYKHNWKRESCSFYNSYIQNTGTFFHSVQYKFTDKNPVHIVAGSLNKHMTNMCIRMALGNAKWIYDNIPRNTKVVIYGK